MAMRRVKSVSNDEPTENKRITLIQELHPHEAAVSFQTAQNNTPIRLDTSW